MQKLWSILIAVVFGELAQRVLAAAEPACTPERTAEGCVANASRPDGLKLFFEVKGTLIAIEPWSPRQLTLECRNNTGRLVVAALPRFSEETGFEEIWIQRCVLANASVSDVLNALNARVDQKLALEGVREKLRADHFVGLDIASLYLESDETKKSDPSIRLEDGVFRAITNLKKLSIKNIPCERPPNGLQVWSSTNANLTRLYAETLSELTELYLTEPQLTNVSELWAAKKLTVMSLTAPAGELPSLPALTNVSLAQWNVSSPREWAEPALSALSVRRGALSRLPEDWLADSAALRTLELRGLRLRALPAGLLRGRGALRELVVSGCGLASAGLPDGLLRDNDRVEKLDLSHNQLKSIPGFILRLTKLKELNLSFNQLAVAADYSLGLPALLSLSLDYNPLGDTCAEHRVGPIATVGNSWLQPLRALRVLSLRGTGAARLCPDWLRHMPALETLDLTSNRLTKLEYADLHPTRNPSIRGTAKIVLHNNNITTIEYSQEDYDKVRPSDQWSVTVKLNRKLTCDCRLYWFARSLAAAPQHASVERALCGAAADERARGRPLRAVPPDALQCAEPCAPRCRCALLPGHGGVRAHCLALPVQLLNPDPPPVVEVSLAGAGLRALPSADALPAAVRTLDLRNNSLGGAGAAAARALLRRPALRLLLAGNALDCRCGRRELVDALLEHQDRVDWNEWSCSEAGLPLRTECAPPPGLAAGLVALLGVLGALGAAGALLLGALAHPKLRARLKTALRVLGVRVPARAGDAPREYDAFVSYAQADARWVAGTLAPALEAAPAPRRLCLHYRDWNVGELILEQIVRSVRQSRRTVLVVSDAFARSDWARAEFDEAMAVAAREARPPPLVVLLAPPAPASLAAAPALADYLRAATYLRADDPRFAHKLRAAVPPARDCTGSTP